MNLTEENQKFIASWEQERINGQLWFVGKFAISFILGLMTIHLLLNFKEVTSVGITYFLEGIRFFVYIVMGFGYGFYKWGRNEKNYHRLQKEGAMLTV